MKYLFPIIAFLGLLGLASCIEDGYVTDSSAQPEFSVDTLKMGTFFTEDLTPTFRFLVYNRHDKILNISSIRVRNNDKGHFRLNVDGISGKEFSNIDIRPNDSIFVFVDATLPENNGTMPVDFEDYIDFVTNGLSTSVVLAATGQDVSRRHGVVIERDTTWHPEYPVQIFDSLVVKDGATLTLEAGVKLHFHDKAKLHVDGRLVTRGTPEAPVEMSGDRTDNVVGQIPFDLMASQWEGVYFSPASSGNDLRHTVIRNTVNGVVADSLQARGDIPGLYMLNCRLRNSACFALESHHSSIVAVGCEIADASWGAAYLRGGDLRFNHCTFANYYLFTALRGPILQFVHYDDESSDGTDAPFMTALFTNSIVYGNGTDLPEGDFTGCDVTIHRCLLKSAGKDDDNFLDCLWDSDPLYYTVREDYIFDYRLRDESPAIGGGLGYLVDASAVTDFYGLTRSTDSPDLGAYVYTPSVPEP